MPNWCMTDYVIVGEKEVVSRINDAVENHKTTEGASSDWEGDILKALGIDVEGRSLRGFVEDHSFEGNELRLYCQEAWYLTEFTPLLRQKFDVEIYWKAEEPGMEIYQTNDEKGWYFPERYLVDANTDGNWESEYFETEQQCLKWIEGITGLSTKEQVAEFNELKKGEEFIYIHEFEYVN